MLSYNMASIATQLQAQLELLVTGKCYNQDRYYLYPSGRSETASMSLHEFTKPKRSLCNYSMGLPN
jgi:hypothetical protein